MTTDIDIWGPDETAALAPSGNIEAERILAATAMADPGCVDDMAAKGFDPADISDERCRMVWFAVEELTGTMAASTIRWQAIAHKLQVWHGEGRMTTRPFTENELSELYMSAIPGAAEYWATAVTKAAVAGRTAALGASMRVRATSPAFDPDTDVAAIQAEVDNLVRPAGQSQMVDLGDLLPDVLVRAITPPTNENRVPTGVIDLDALLSGGFAPGQMVVIAARPVADPTASPAEDAAIEETRPLP